jgi:hypothetical protein
MLILGRDVSDLRESDIMSMENVSAAKPLILWRPKKWFN